MKEYLNIYLTFFAIFYVVIFYFRINNAEEITKFIIPAFVFMILLFVFLTNDSKNRNNILLYFVFLFIFLGDTIINLTEKKQLSIIPFSLTHIFLAIYYILDIRILKKDFLFLIPVLCFSALLIVLIGEDISGKSHLVIFIVYLSILDLMFWRALCYLRSDQQRSRIWFIISGSLMFYLTDIFVCLNLIYPEKLFIVLMWLLYPPALISLSLINISLFENKYIYKGQTNDH